MESIASNEPTHESDDEIDLLDLVAVLLRYKWFIIGITLLAALGVVAYSIGSLMLPPEKSYLPNFYTPKAHMLINDSSSSGGLSSMLNSSGLSGIASLMGVSAGISKSNSALAVYLTQTNTFLDAIVDEFDLINRWEIENHPRTSSRDILKKSLEAKFDGTTGVFTLSFTDIDPSFAQSVINFAVALLEQRFEELGVDKSELKRQNLEANIANAYKEILSLMQKSQNLDASIARGQLSINGSNLILEVKQLERELKAQETIYTELKTQYELLKVEMASESPVFQILEYAEIPDQKSGPGRGMLCIIVTFAAFFGSVFLAFVVNAIQNIRKDPLAMAKLKGK